MRKDEAETMRPPSERRLGDECDTWIAPARAVTVLHIEDLQIQRKLIARYLRSMSDFTFTLLYADSEDEAISVFDEGGVGLVLLDYYLKQGDGSHCLRKMRGIDPIVPVIAITGGTDIQIVSELHYLGVDDYINKRALNADIFCRSVRRAIDRAEAWRLSMAGPSRPMMAAPQPQARPRTHTVAHP